MSRSNADWGHPTHAHDFHQFLYVPLGRITVTAHGCEHRLSPSVGVWIPAGCRTAPGSAPTR
ncbi:AraC family ligand binding domain-containing protein [Nonomuraea endophytica]|uniref:AraC family ligand binding domain-containing protein n=1 Tax=Nonomuraea endophytica TaxID=714136 RepID=UPI0037C73CE8